MVKKTINVQNFLKDFLEGLWGGGGAFFKNKKDTFDWRLREGDSRLGGLLGQLRVFWSVPSADPLGIQLLPCLLSRAIAPQMHVVHLSLHVPGTFFVPTTKYVCHMHCLLWASHL